MEEALAFAQPIPTLEHQLGPGLDDAQRDALGVGAEARHGFAEGRCRVAVETQPLGRHGRPKRQDRRTRCFATHMSVMAPDAERGSMPDRRWATPIFLPARPGTPS